MVGVVRLSGIIGQMGAFRQGLSLTSLAETLEKVFKTRRLKAVALAINSPGGSPVQAALIAGRIRALAQEKDIPVYAFTEDVAASGGYWLACAADHIYANENSIIGSIGVVSAGFGFTDLMKRTGIERRMYTSGDKKAPLDPFREENAEEVGRLKAIQGDIHESFRAHVRSRRGGRLKADEEVLFSGEFWTGARALELGLIDGIGDMRGVLREHYGEKLKLRLIGPRKSWWRKRSGLAGFSFPAAEPGDWAGAAIAAVEERLIWNRFGL